MGGASERSCSCVNHVRPYAAFLRSTRASEIDRQPSLASQQRGQRESKVTAKDLPQSVMGCGGSGGGRGGRKERRGEGRAYVSRHSCSATYSESQARLHCCKTSP